VEWSGGRPGGCRSVEWRMAANCRGQRVRESKWAGQGLATGLLARVKRSGCEKPERVERNKCPKLKKKLIRDRRGKAE